MPRASARHDCGTDRIEACTGRNPHKPGAAKRRRALGSDVTLSELEELFVALLTAHDVSDLRPRLAA